MKRVLIINTMILILLAMIALNPVALGQNNAGPHIDPTKSDPGNKKEIQMIHLSTYLLFNGTCKQAMEFYKSCFGGELTLSSVGQSPMKKMFPDSMHSKTLNAKLISENFDISASDWLRPTQTPVKGNMVCLYLSGGKPQQLKALFNKLSEGAEITDPLKIEAFGTYGALNDKFGVRWMFHTDQLD
ncbi:MAG: VOC family protein [Saprospiraceae bacterium]